jgi:nucleoredoxin
VKDISLMLRSGYSLATVEKEVSTRHFFDGIDPVAEKALLQAGATPDFVERLKSGAFDVPAAEIATVQEELAAKTRRRELQAAEAQKLNTLYQAQKAAPPAPAKTVVGTPIYDLIKGDLVTSKNGILQTYNDQPLEQKKLIALYFSAHWCGPCRKFTPQLVEYYNRVAPSHPEFEIVFVSNDRSGPAMEAYMRDMQMPWPAVKFEKIAEKGLLNQYAGPGIPCLVLMDGAGRVLSHSYDGKTYRGPAKVVADLEAIFAGGVAGQVAQQR